MCSEVKRERFDTGSDTVIHSAQIKTHVSLELIVLSAKNYRNTENKYNDIQHGQSVFVIFCLIKPPKTIIKQKSKDNKDNVIILVKKNIQNKILFKLPVVPPLSPLPLSLPRGVLFSQIEASMRYSSSFNSEIYSTARGLIQFINKPQCKHIPAMIQ